MSHFILQFVAWISCGVAMVTSIALLADAPRVPIDRSLRGWAQHYAKLMHLALCNIGAGMLFFFPSLFPVTVFSVLVVALFAAGMALNTPCPWWRYVFQNRSQSRQRSTNLRTTI